MFTIYIAKTVEILGLPAARIVYEQALEVLPDHQMPPMCTRFAQLERKLGEIDRARAVYAHASQFCDPRTNGIFWAEWNNFEIEVGSEDTFREMLRIKRSVQARFNTAKSFLAAQATTKRDEFDTLVDEPERTTRDAVLDAVIVNSQPKTSRGNEEIPSKTCQNADEIQTNFY